MDLFKCVSTFCPTTICPTNNTLSTSFCPIGFRVRIRVPLTTLIFFEIEPKVTGQKNRTKRHGRIIVGQKDHPLS